MIDGDRGDLKAAPKMVGFIKGSNLRELFMPNEVLIYAYLGLACFNNGSASARLNARIFYGSTFYSAIGSRRSELLFLYMFV